MRSSEYTRDPFGERRPLDLAGLLARLGEEIVAEPEDLEAALRRSTSDAKVLFGLGTFELSATIRGLRRILIADGPLGIADYRNGLVEELPISRGKLPVGLLKGYPVGRKPLEADSREWLRAIATVVGLALDAAHARELAAQRAAQGSAVQIASEAFGAILHERKLYRTVLILTSELFGAPYGAVLPGEGTVVSLGLEGEDETLAALGRVRIR